MLDLLKARVSLTFTEETSEMISSWLMSVARLVMQLARVK
jgi:hypothetical protein